MFISNINNNINNIIIYIDKMYRYHIYVEKIYINISSYIESNVQEN